MPIDQSELNPQSYYWARRLNDEELEVVQVSTVFGTGPDHISVAVMGSAQHYSLNDFEFIELIGSPVIA